MFSICCCSYKDFEYFKLLYASLKKNTKVPYELIVHVNEPTVDILNWLELHGDVKFSYSEDNLGVAAVNQAVKQAKYDFIVDINADMYALPMWDLEILKQINVFKSQGIKKYTISSTLIEPVGNNPEFTIFNSGVSVDNFDEQLLLKTYAENYVAWQKPDQVQYSHPISMPKALWNEMGGVDTTYWPGQASDHDIAASAYKAGCRHFKRLGKSRLYHFVSRGITSLPPEQVIMNGQDIFEKKWNISVEKFRMNLGVNKLFDKVQEGLI